MGFPATPANAGPEPAIRALVELAKLRGNGVLDLSAAGWTGAIYVAEGMPVHAVFGGHGETLGRLLVRQGRITPEQLDRVVEALSGGALADGSPARFGDVVVGLGFLTAEDLADALYAQIREKVVACLGREGVTVTYDPDVSRLAAVDHYPSATEAVVLGAVRGFSDARVEAILRPHLDAFPCVVDEFDEVAARFELTDDERDLLAQIDGTGSLRTLLAVTSGEEDVPSLVAALYLCEAAKMLRSPMGLPGTVRPSHRKVMPRPISLPAPPPREPPKAPPVVRERIAADVALKRFKEDVEKRRKALAPQQTARAPKDERERVLYAEEAFQAGRKLLTLNPRKAADELARAAELVPDSVEYGLYAAWARSQADARGFDDKRRAQLRDLAIKAQAHDANRAFPYYVLGTLAMLEGLDATALRLFKRAHALDPSDTDVARRLKLLSRREVQDKPRRPSIPEAERTRTSLDDVLKSVLRTTFAGFSKNELEGPPAAAAGPASDAERPAPLSPAAAAAPDRASAPSEAASPAGRATANPTPAPLSPPPTPAAAQAPVSAPTAPTAIPSTATPDATAAPAVTAPSPKGEAGPPRARLLALLLLLVAVLAATPAIFRAFEGRPPTQGTTARVNAAPPPTSAPARLASASAPMSVPAAVVTATDAADASPEASVSPLTSASVSPPSSGSTPQEKGELRLGKTAAGHRVYLDGKLVGAGSGTLSVPCGGHTIRIGSHGAAQKIVVPCGGAVDLP